MTRCNQTIPIVAILIALLAAPVLAEQASEKFKGEVVAVQQQTQNQGTDQLVTVRTRNGERRQFRLGDGSCGNCVQVGDQVRARVSRGAGGQAGQVQNMQVKRNGEMYGYSNQSGQLVRTQQRLRDGTGGKQANRQIGSGGNGSSRGNCNGSGGNRGGGGGHGGGRGQGGGGR